MKKINILFVLVFLIAVMDKSYQPNPTTGGMAQYGMVGMCQHRLMM